MEYLSVKEIAEKWRLSERSVRNYCQNGRVAGAILQGKTWMIPQDASRPERVNARMEPKETLLEILHQEKENQVKGGIYHKVQIELTYNSNHMEGSRLTHDQTRYIYETNTIGMENDSVNVDDVVETVNHFRCIDFAIAQANQPLSEAFIKALHKMLKTGTSDSNKKWFAVGDYKKMPNEVGGRETALPEEVPAKIRSLLQEYNVSRKKGLEEILNFHYEFERIHPFQDGNGRVGRLIMFKECLRNGIVPFVIADELKMYYYRGLREWKTERGYLRDTCLAAQDRFKAWLDYFRIPYDG